jgi:hypothetical protein
MDYDNNSNSKNDVNDGNAKKDCNCNNGDDNLNNELNNMNIDSHSSNRTVLAFAYHHQGKSSSEAENPRVT